MYRPSMDSFDRSNYSSIDPTERGKNPAQCFGFTLLTISIMYIVFSRIPFHCENCPLTGFLIGGIVMTSISFTTTCSLAIGCYREVKKEQMCLNEKGNHRVTAMCTSFIALALGIAGTVLVSRICPDLKC